MTQKTYYWRNIKYIMLENLSFVNLIWATWNILIWITILPALFSYNVANINGYYWYWNNAHWFAIIGGFTIWVTIMFFIIYEERVNLKYNILDDGGF